MHAQQWLAVRTGATRLLANGVCEESATEGIYGSPLLLQEMTAF
jgi:hypothetical protein